MLVWGVVAAWRQHTSPIPAAQQPMAPFVAALEAGPSTKPPESSAFDSYKVAPDAPRYIFISKIAVRAMVRSLGLTKDNHLDAPANIHDAGWFNQSSKPGEKGATVIDGHMGWRSNPGIFYKLKELKADDMLTIERGDGKVLTYKVVQTQSYDVNQVDMAAALAPINPSKPGLNLITCDGKLVNNNEYDKRLVIFTEQL